mgnify:CR=1 FL=1
MRVIIYGAGAIGGVTGGELALAGFDTLFIGRAHLVNALNEKGLKVISPAGSPVVRVDAVTGPDRITFRPDDVVFLSVKSQDTEGVSYTGIETSLGSAVYCTTISGRYITTTSDIDVYGTVRASAADRRGGQEGC